MSFKRRLKYLYPIFQLLILFFAILALTDHQIVYSQDQSKEQENPKHAKSNREMGLRLLDEMKTALKDNYFDPNFHGINLEARFKAAKERIKTLNYNWQVYRVLAQVLLDLNDSHTRLNVPPRADNFEYGFSVQMFGNECLITKVKNGSDAEAKGLKVGDQILKIRDFTPTRENLWKILYVLYEMDQIDFVELKIRGVDGAEKQLTVKGRTWSAKEMKEERKKRKKEEQEKPFKCQEINTELIACKLYTFAVEKDQIDKMMKQIGQHSKLILDLRGNGGGYVITEEHLTSYLFDHNVKIADTVSKGKKEERIAKSKKDKSFKGELLVLIDSKSASAAEITARVVQLEKRGKIVGDVSSGQVMTSIYVPFVSPYTILNGYVLSYVGMNLTVSDVIMSDGSRLEHVGVMPDVPIVPTGVALAQRTDPVLAYAALLLGGNLTPEKAGEFYFISAKSENDNGSDSDDKDDK
ncbi:MAG: S41 family peptidase [Pyrinomonadaceae bacterium]